METVVDYSQVVFLGGTCGDNHWREEIMIPALIERGVPAEVLFNPVLPAGASWDDAARQREDECKSACRIMLYVLASPDPHSGTTNTSAYSLCEAIMSLYDDRERTVVVVDDTGMPKHTAKAMRKIYWDLCQRFPDAAIFGSYETAVDFLAGKLLA